MSKFNYSRLQATATRLIDRFSETDISIERTAAPTVVDGEIVPPAAPTTASASAVVVPYTANQIDGNIIQAGDLQVFLDSAYKPLINDVFIIDTDRYVALNIEKYKPSSTALAYKIQVRK